MALRSTPLLFISIIVLIYSSAALSGCVQDKIDFAREIRPLLNKHCIRCHGGVRQQGDLNLIYQKLAFRPAASGKIAIVPGEPQKSELIRRITHADPEIRMPHEADALSPKEIDLLTRWIQQGAAWSPHWAYQPLTDAPSPPDIQDAWISNDIDRFILDELHRQDLSPNPIAHPDELARRVSLDLIGLPLSSHRMYDLQDPQDYNYLVDSLLSSIHYGEHWAAMWLDLARYADSRGYQKDILRPDMWRYRDWVIHALHRDMPFDTFTIYQLAGDLLPDSSEQALLATAFHRNTMTNDEGGTDNEEFRIAAVIDRINTTMEIWQATTMSCVQCHDHPYDPFPQRDFYQLMAYFDNTADADDEADQPTASLRSPIQSVHLGTTIDATNPFDSLQILHLRDFIQSAPGQVPIMQELHGEHRRITRAFHRGNWLLKTDTILPDVPAILDQGSFSSIDDRLDLASWLCDTSNPLTARVLVNRIWAQLFGQGLVKHLDDFGTQTTLPVHQPLLDFLAYRLMHEHRWHLKPLIKEIVLSSTYRQSSNMSDLHALKDPSNTYHARGPRHRLSAEQIRDQALAVSGLLYPVVYGPSVKPYQPDGVWNVIRHVAHWDQATDRHLYRRGLYTFWRRVSPYPSMVLFDTPSREICTSRRIRTNTPLQALVTLNDPTFVDAAAALASKMLSAHNIAEKQIAYGYQAALGRAISPDKAQVLQELYDTALIHYQGQDDVDHLHLSLLQVASAILNLDEFIMKS